MAFNLEKFNVLETPEVIVNIWFSALHVKTCHGNCRIQNYLKLCIEALKMRWMPEWGLFEEIKNKIMANDKSFVNDLNNLCSVHKQYLVDFVNEI